MTDNEKNWLDGRDEASAKKAFDTMSGEQLAQWVRMNVSDSAVTYAIPYLEYVIAGCWGAEKERESFLYVLCNVTSWRGVCARAWKAAVRERFHIA